MQIETPREQAEETRSPEEVLQATVHEIVDAVLDAADQDILEGVDEDLEAPVESSELLKDLMLDVLRRYRARRRREAAGSLRPRSVAA